MERGRGEGRNEKGIEGKGKESGDKVEGGIWPTQKFWRGALYARPLAGFKGAASRRGGGEKEGRGTEREKRGRREEKGREESWNRAANWLRPALQQTNKTNKPVLIIQSKLSN